MNGNPPSNSTNSSAKSKPTLLDVARQADAMAAGLAALASTPSERRIGGAAGALAAGAIGVAMAPLRAEAAPGADAELIAACERFGALEHAKRRIFAGTPNDRAAEIAAEPAIDAIYVEQNDLMTRIAALQAITLDGIRARVRLAFAAECRCFDGGGDLDDQMLAALLHDLHALLRVGSA